MEILLNQSKFCGIGNYLKSEILYACKISPYRILKDLNDRDRKNIYIQSNKIIKASYADGGGSSGDFTDLDNKKGNYKFKMMVYNKKTDPLGNTIKKETTKDKRTTHWIPDLKI